MKKILLNIKDMDISMTAGNLSTPVNYGDAKLTKDSSRYNVAQLLDNQNIPLSPLIDVKTSIYEDKNSKEPVNVLYNVDSSQLMSTAFDTVVTSVNTNSDNTAHVETVGISQLYYRMFGIQTLQNTAGFRCGLASVKSSLPVGGLSNNLFTYIFSNPGVYNPVVLSPSSQYIWLAVKSSEIISQANVNFNSDGEMPLTSDSSYYIGVQGYSENDSPQYIELDTTAYRNSDYANPDIGEYIIFFTDSLFGIGLNYNIIVKPGSYFWS